ncbi:MAG: zeta toxin family protein [Acidobacteria bacterium]|nr:zeta toxin family protein [Acidobacteriota bacterium]
MEPKPKVIVIAGCNGAGKSTLAPHLLRDTFGLTDYVNADTIAQGLSAFAPEKVALEAGRVMLKRLRDLAERRANFAFESTLASRSYAPWIAELKQQGYEFDLFFIWLNSPELAARRVEERVRLGGHSIEETTIRRRYQRGLENFFALYQPLASSWTVYDNSSIGNLRLVADQDETAPPQIYETELWEKICKLINPK